MKKNVLILLLSLVILFFACNGTISPPSIGSVNIDRIPVFSARSTVVKNSRSFIPSDMIMEDIFYTMLAPPITKFEKASNSYFVGDSLDINLFGNFVTLDTSMTDEGYVMMFGKIIEEDSNGDEIETGKIEIIYDMGNSQFSYYSEVLLSVPDSFEWGLGAHMYLIHEIPLTQIDEYNSFITSFKTLIYLKQCSECLEIQLVKEGELFSGSSGTNDWIVGFAFASFEYLQDEDFSDIGINSDNLGMLVNDDSVP